MLSRILAVLLVSTIAHPASSQSFSDWLRQPYERPGYDAPRYQDGPPFTASDFIRPSASAVGTGWMRTSPTPDIGRTWRGASGRTRIPGIELPIAARAPLF